MEYAMRSLAILLAAGLALCGCEEERATRAVSGPPPDLPIAEPEPPPAEIAVDNAIPSATPAVVLPEDAAAALAGLRLVGAAAGEGETAQCARAALAAAGVTAEQGLPFDDPARLRASLALARQAAATCPEEAAREIGEWLGADTDT
jgi:hypothetical protein